MANTIEPAIDIRNVSKTYAVSAGRVHALEDVSVQIAEGEFVSLLGPSGCGKSTLLHMTAGLIPFDGGTIFVRGRRVVRPVTELGIVFQRDLLMPWRTAIENVLLQAEMRGSRTNGMRDRAMSLLKQVGLGEFHSQWPHELSGGMRQRVAIARALIHDPPLLLMDEPFGALDAITRDQMNLDLLELWSGSGKTVLFVTHSIEEAVFMSDRVIVMESRPGRLRAEVRIDLPRPRRLAMRDDPALRAYCHQIRSEFESMGYLRDRQPRAEA